MSLSGIPLRGRVTARVSSHQLGTVLQPLFRAHRLLAFALSLISVNFASFFFFKKNTLEDCWKFYNIGCYFRPQMRRAALNTNYLEILIFCLFDTCSVYCASGTALNTALQIFIKSQAHGECHIRIC